MGTVTNEEFMGKVARYAECVYNRNSRIFIDKNKKANSWEKIGAKFNLSCLFMKFFSMFPSVLKLTLSLAAKFPPRCPPCCLL